MPERYTQQEHEDNDSTSVAVIRNDIKYMRADLAEIKAQVRSSNDIYATKTQSLELRLDMEKSLDATNKRVDRIYAYGGSVIGIITLILIYAFFKLILKVAP